MKTLEIKNVVAALHDTIFWNRKVDKLDPSVGLYFRIRLSFNNYGYENDGDTKHEDWVRSYESYVHVIITAGTRVYIAESNKFYLHEVPLADFVNTSNHDSCWRSDGLQPIERICYNAFAYCREGSPEEHQQNSVSVFCHLEEVGGGVFDFVKIKRGAKREDNDYFDTLESIEKVEWNINFPDRVSTEKDGN